MGADNAAIHFRGARFDVPEHINACHRLRFPSSRRNVGLARIEERSRAREWPRAFRPACLTETSKVRSEFPVEARATYGRRRFLRRHEAQVCSLLSALSLADLSLTEMRQSSVGATLLPIRKFSERLGYRRSNIGVWEAMLRTKRVIFTLRRAPRSRTHRHTSRCPRSSFPTCGNAIVETAGPFGLLRVGMISIIVDRDRRIQAWIVWGHRSLRDVPWRWR